MIRNRIAKLVEQSTLKAQEEGLIPRISLPQVFLEWPQNPEHGDYAATIALKLARAAKMNPMEIANSIASFLPHIKGVESFSVVHPGFINFVLSKEWMTGQVDEILENDDKYGDSLVGEGTRIQLEFVSVNPTGPLHVGHGRGAVLGSTLANVLERAGYRVEKEYYVNNAGSQMWNFYASLHARYREILGLSSEIPPNGYWGDYVTDLAREIVDEKGEAFVGLSEEEAIPKIGEIGLGKVLSSIKEELQLLGVEFDVWFSEKSLYELGLFDRTMQSLWQNGHVDEREGAQWFVSTELGEDKDNVLIRSDGMPTYFAADIAYHYDKFMGRGFDRVIDIWGADHQGHVARMKAAIRAMGISPERLHILISQMVSLRRGEEVLKASKRAGDIITLRELMDEVGPDVCRFFFLSRSADSQMDFDLEVAKRELMDNPVYYVQYAHARIAGIMRRACEKGFDYSQGDVSHLKGEAELVLIKKLILFPEILEMAATTLEPQHLPSYAQDLATAFHNFYERCRVISHDVELTTARLKLVEATRIMMAKTLHLMGMRAPERM